MSDALHCEGCGAALASADAVCPSCEAELSAQPPAPEGRYVCPHCLGRLAAPATVLWPPTVPWWRPTTMRLQCPHCETPLCDRHRKPVLETLWLLGLGLPACLLSSETTYRWRGLGVALVLAGYALWVLRVDRKAARDPERYVVGSRPSWLRALSDLQASATIRRPPPSDEPRG